MPCGRAHGLLSVFVSMALAIAAVSSTGKQRTEPPPVPESNPPMVSFKPPRIWDSPSTDPLVMNASAALRDAGYHIMGAAFEMFAAEVLPSGPATFFANNDPALVNITLPSWLMLNLLRYHMATEMLLWNDL
ncbi:hypothetical protein SUGI_0384750 [Cryptomeria japonica]|nr:hypothetical protein SUGI_0384750 [Cryptomeria japonica]